jgi:hypothetical protein
VSRKVNAAIQQVDIVIGTHKLLSSDVQFERLGLVIIVVRLSVAGILNKPRSADRPSGRRP